jgi:hypothetical protein
MDAKLDPEDFDIDTESVSKCKRLVHRTGIFWAHLVASLQVSTLHPVPSFWWRLAHTQLTRDPLSRQHQHQPAHGRQKYPNP